MPALPETGYSFMITGLAAKAAWGALSISRDSPCAVAQRLVPDEEPNFYCLIFLGSFSNRESIFPTFINPTGTNGRSIINWRRRKGPMFRLRRIEAYSLSAAQRDLQPYWLHFVPF
jgi:hypothetical protein